ncbi:MAG: hypothetical protein ACJ748_07930 [Flavisolibacter sp.]|jgi:hypothetical protein
MKKRIHRVLNFFALNLLFFALYLNFIHKDINQQDLAPHKSAPSAAAVQGTVLVNNPEQYLNKAGKNQPATITPEVTASEKKLSFN